MCVGGDGDGRQQPPVIYQIANKSSHSFLTLQIWLILQEESTLCCCLSGSEFGGLLFSLKIPQMCSRAMMHCSPVSAFPPGWTGNCAMEATAGWGGGVLLQGGGSLPRTKYIGGGENPSPELFRGNPALCGFNACLALRGVSHLRRERLSHLLKQVHKAGFVLGQIPPGHLVRRPVKQPQSPGSPGSKPG